MNGHRRRCLDGILHAHGFVYIDVIAFHKFPRLVGANRNGGHIKGTVALPHQIVEIVEPRRVSGKEDFLASMVPDETLATPEGLVAIGSHPTGPVSHGDTNDPQRLAPTATSIGRTVVVINVFVPIQFVDHRLGGNGLVTPTLEAQRNHKGRGRRALVNLPHRGRIQMIVMIVGNQDHVHQQVAANLGNPAGRWSDGLRSVPLRGRAALGKDGIRQNGTSLDLNQQRGVSQPGHLNNAIRRWMLESVPVHRLDGKVFVQPRLRGRRKFEKFGQHVAHELQALVESRVFFLRFSIDEPLIPFAHALLHQPSNVLFGAFLGRSGATHHSTGSSSAGTSSRRRRSGNSGRLSSAVHDGGYGFCRGGGGKES